MPKGQARKVWPKIDVFYNGQYAYSTERFRLCREAVADALERAYIYICDKGFQMYYPTKGAHITANKRKP